MGVAQLVELLVVVQAVAGSSPVAHPLRTRRREDGRRSGRQDAVHHGREPRDRPRDRRARRARRRQRRAAGQDRRAAPEAPGHDLHGGGGDRGGRRHRAADRRRRARRRLGRGRGRAGRRALRRHRHPRQQRERDLADPDRADRAQALRPDAEHQRARHLPRHPRLHPAPQALRQRPHPHAVAAAQPRAALARRPRRLHALEVRHEPAHARRGRRSCARRASPPTRCGRARSSRPPRSRTCSAATRRWARRGRPRSTPTPPT